MDEYKLTLDLLEEAKNKLNAATYTYFQRQCDGGEDCGAYMVDPQVMIRQAITGVSTAIEAAKFVGLDEGAINTQFAIATNNFLSSNPMVTQWLKVPAVGEDLTF